MQSNTQLEKQLGQNVFLALLLPSAFYPSILESIYYCYVSKLLLLSHTKIYDKVWNLETEKQLWHALEMKMMTWIPHQYS